MPRRHLSATDFPTVQEVRSRWAEEEARMREYIERLAPGSVVLEIRYAHFDGAPQKAVFWHMLQHVVNHATFHRGQVTAMLRQLGARPPKSQDLIAFYRISDR